jgi:hypothetical protein
VPSTWIDTGLAPPGSARIVQLAPQPVLIAMSAVRAR